MFSIIIIVDFAVWLGEACHYVTSAIMTIQCTYMESTSGLYFGVQLNLPALIN